MSELACPECIELCPDVALGIADAEDRASVLEHIERCRSCRDELGTLSGVADLLGELVPPVEPPASFASRVVSSISRPSRAEQRAPSSRRSYVRPLSVAAAVVVAAAIGVGGWLAARGGSGPSQVETSSLFSHDRAVGQVVVASGTKPWISVSVHVDTRSKAVRCEVEASNGAWRTIGTFDVYDGWGFWSAPLPSGVVVRRAELLTPDGKVVAAAALS
jgi:anti-sigma-K factor RskA